MPTPDDVSPGEFYPDACEQVERERAEHAADLQAQADGLDEDPVILAIGNARTRREAAEREIRLLLAYAREFHADRPYKLEQLAQAAGMTPSGVRTAFKDGEVGAVAKQIGRRADGRRYRDRADGERP
ncbi:hypothetical protein [Streptomyces sp. NPDC002133]|uniref:hypothetical protein n=1 Tax=Streptomyces sp. NPDC002133 TaxID=3154409 RepID=UPI00332CDBC5